MAHQNPNPGPSGDQVVMPVHAVHGAPPLPSAGDNSINLNQPPPPPPPTDPPQATAGPTGYAGGQVMIDFSEGLQSPPPPPPPAQPAPAGARRDPRLLARQKSMQNSANQPPKTQQTRPSNVVAPQPPTPPVANKDQNRPTFEPLREPPKAPKPAPVLPGLSTAKPPPLPSVSGLGLEADDDSITAMAGMETAVLPPRVNLTRDTRAPPPRRASAISPTTAERPSLNRQSSKPGVTTPTNSAPSTPTVLIPGASAGSVSPRAHPGRSPGRSPGSSTGGRDREDPIERDKIFNKQLKEKELRYSQLCANHEKDPSLENKRKMDEEKWELDMLTLDIEINQILINKRINGNSLLVS